MFLCDCTREFGISHLLSFDALETGEARLYIPAALLILSLGETSLRLVLGASVFTSTLNHFRNCCTCFKGTCSTMPKRQHDLQYMVGSRSERTIGTHHLLAGQFQRGLQRSLIWNSLLWRRDPLTRSRTFRINILS